MSQGWPSARLLQVIRYLRMIAVITPYAQFRFAYRAEDERNSVHFVFVRRTDKMPAPPTVCLFGFLSYVLGRSVLR